MTVDPKLPPDAAAAEWFALKRSGEMTAGQLLEFQAWLAASPDHDAAWDEAEQSWAMAGMLRADPELMLLRAEARRAFPAVRRRLVAGAIAAALVAAAGLGFVATQPSAVAPLIGADQQTFRTGIGQKTTVTLADGSVVTLDTDTVLRTDDAGRERRMYLDRGRAFFRVAHNPGRPFIVHAAGRRVTALGTAFDVRVDDGAFEVTLVEGKVRVEQPRALLRPSQAADLKAGQQIAAATPREWVVKPADVERETGWVQGRLTFVDEPLSQVAEEMNRYTEKKIVMRDEDVGAQPVVAVLKPGDLDAFVKMVRSYDLARVTETEDAIELSALEAPRR